MPSARVEKLGEPRRVLIVLPTWVGDFIMATPTLRAIRVRFASAEITFLAVSNLNDLIASGDWMDAVELRPSRGSPSGVMEAARMIRRLRRRRFDLAVLLPNSFRSAALAWLSGARRRVGYDRDGRGLLLTDRLPVLRRGGEIEPHPICAYYGRIATALGCPQPGDRLELYTDDASERVVEERLCELGFADRRPLVVFSPGASFGASKLWLPERFAALGDGLIDQYGAAVVVTCGPGEEPIARKIVSCMSRGGSVLDSSLLSLAEVKALIKRSDLVVCNDAGPRHIAKAFEVPVVTVFGPTHQAWTDTNYPLERKIQIDVECGPCQQRVCPLGHHECMTGVTVDMVHAACGELLERKRVMSGAEA